MKKNKNREIDSKQIHLVCDELYNLKNRLQIYKTISSNDAPYYSLQFLTPILHRNIQISLSRDLILGICRLLDSAGKNDSANLNLNYIYNHLNKDDPTAKQIKKLRTNKNKRKIFNLRHKVIAHKDLKIATGESSLPKVDLKIIEEFLDEIINITHKIYIEEYSTNYDFSFNKYLDQECKDLNDRLLKTTQR